MANYNAPQPRAAEEMEWTFRGGEGIVEGGQWTLRNYKRGRGNARGNAHTIFARGGGVNGPVGG
jgi:hypothetical protein